MDKHKFLLFVSLLLAFSLFPGVERGWAESAALDPANPAEVCQGVMRCVTREMREAAAARAAAARKSQQAVTAVQPLVPVPGGFPDYFGTYPNYANSPIIRKFVDTLPGLGYDNRNNLGQYIPVAVPDTTAYPGSDYYEIGLTDHSEQMHSDLPATKVRGYFQINTTDPNVSAPHYLGPLIIAQKDRPVRMKFDNLLGTGAAGNLFVPVDTTEMGAGLGPQGAAAGNYTENRASVHLHGGATPWISDGTPHQWITPAGEATSYKKGVSHRNVPDMPNPGAGSATNFYTNQQSARLMFYHDHALGITRLNVYAGEAAGYLLTDSTEEGLINSGILPDQGTPAGVYRYGIPLIIQDKSYVDAATIPAQDPTWNWGTTPPVPNTGDLWFPHVYMPNQNPADLAGVNAMGRWDYGPWFWPPMDPSTLVGKPVQCPGYPAGVMCPGTPNPSIVPEAFMDTPIVNGTAYPVLTVGRQAYRFRILNAANDRTIGLQLYYAADAAGNVCKGTVTAGCTEIKMMPAIPHSATSSRPLCTAATITDPNGLAIAKVSATGYPSNKGTGLPGGCWPTTWPTDSRAGGVPDPATAGPAIIQIGNEGGLLPAPVAIPSTPIGYNYNRRDIVVLNVSSHSLILGPAERADVVIDFSQVPDGARLIMYNDAPAPMPAFDTRYDYYTGDPDQTSTGGAPTTLAGFGPNTRTIMQFVVSGATAAAPFDLAGLKQAFNSTATTQGAYAASQPAPLVPESAYGPAFNTSFADTYSTIFSTSLTFTPYGSATQTNQPIKRKAIQELFELNYGRMNATLGVELPLTNFLTQTTIPLGYIDPPTETMPDSKLQIWKITHNGVDTHTIHFHLFNVQVINRVGWDGAVRPPDSNELGWKEAVRMNPLEDAIVAIQPIKPIVPFAVPDSVRPLDPSSALGTTGQFTNIDPKTNNPKVVYNNKYNFGWEYVWHCHLLGHEENDMMRPIVFQVAPGAPKLVSAAAGNAQAAVYFKNSSTGGSKIVSYTVTSSPGGLTATGASSPITVNGLTNGTSYTFTVTATNNVGTSPSSSPSNSVTPQ